jgi:hypothetical protein
VARNAKLSSARSGIWDPGVVKTGWNLASVCAVLRLFLLSKSDRSVRSWAGECYLTYTFQLDPGSGWRDLCRKRVFLCCFWCRFWPGLGSELGQDR